MDSANPERARLRTGRDPRSAPVARISRNALARNARAAFASGAWAYAPALLRADAWGHGAATVTGVLDAEGFRRVAAGGSQRSAKTAERAISTTASSQLDPLTLFGLPGGALESTPVMRLTGTVLSTKGLRAGEGVSYGYSYRAPADTRIALISGGYAQGIVRALGNHAYVAVGGVRHPIVGRIAMDACVIAIGDATLERGDEVVFFGDTAYDEPSIAEWTTPTGLRPGELVAAVGLHAAREDVA